MKPITLDEFYKGRDSQYAAELTDEIRAASQDTLQKANLLLARFFAANPAEPRRTATSGWRPAQVNASTPGAAKLSNHMRGLAIDIQDENGKLDAWCMSPDGRSALIDIGLWLESPASTPRWCHVQTVPPRSGNRVFMV